MNNIHGKLQYARVRLQSMNLKKSGKNSFSGISYYELSDFLPAINEIFEDAGLSSNFSISPDKHATLTIFNAEKPEESVSFSSPTVDVELKGCTPIQGLGAVHTYMKRYLYMNALEIVEHDMLDAKAGSSDMLPDKKIDSINTIEDLNKTYKYYINMPSKDLSWKKTLMKKSEFLGAEFNKTSGIFEKSQNHNAMNSVNG